MTPKLTNEQAAAVDATGKNPVEVKVIHPTSNKVYFVVDDESMNVLRKHRRRQQEDIAAIGEGIEQMNRDEGIALDEAFENIAQRLQLQKHQ